MTIMNNDKVKELWDLLGVTDQASALATIKRLQASAANEREARDMASRLEYPDTSGR